MRFFKFRFFKNKNLKTKILSHVIYFSVIFVFILGGEIAVGMLYEKFAGVILWDYSNIPTHITRYTSIITTLLYGGGVYLLMGVRLQADDEADYEDGHQGGDDC